MPASVIFLAAGRGSRFGSRQPKQFLPYKGQPLFMRSLRTFAALPSVSEIVIVTNRNKISLIKRFLKKIPQQKKIHMTEGGAFRGASVKNGFKALQKKSDVVLVHDCARPLVTKDIVIGVIKAAKKSGAALAAWPVPDTIKLASKNHHVKKTLPRHQLWLAQTPQGFRFDVAVKCLLHPSPKSTDDVALAEKKGYKVALVKASPANIKVTYKQDLKLCHVLEN